MADAQVIAQTMVQASSARTIEQALREGVKRLSGTKTPLLDARVLLKFAIKCDDGELIARAREPMPQSQFDLFLRLVERRTQGEPVAYIVGEKEFWSLPFKVTPHVLIPRADSETLIEAVLQRRDRQSRLSILDLGTGSGCLLCALLSEFSHSVGIGVDASFDAVNVARANAKTLGVGARSAFFVGDWGAAAGDQFDVIISNPPYIRSGEKAGLSSDVSEFEPADALFAGSDGLDAYRQIFAQAPRILKPDGLLVLEAGDDQSDQIAALAHGALPAAQMEKVNDLKGFARVIVADCASDPVQKIKD